MIDKLAFVLALARERHFGRAAESCGVTQPTLSAGLKALEDSLGVLIVARSSRFKGFTPEGERVLAWARRIMGDVNGLRGDLDALKRGREGVGLEGHVRIAVIPTALPMVARLTAPLRTRHPGIRLTILSRNSAEILRLMDDLEIEAGLGYLDNEPLGALRTVPLYRERYCLLTARAGPFGGRISVAWHELGDIPLCLLTPDMQNRRIIDQMLRQAGIVVDPTLVSNSTIVLLSHVRTGAWSSILPPILIDAIGLPDSVVALPIVTPEVSHAVGLLVPHREPTTPIVTALISEARRLAAETASSEPRSPPRR